MTSRRHYDPIDEAVAAKIKQLHERYRKLGHEGLMDMLGQENIHVEQEALKEAVGSQDQTSAAYGGFNRIEFKKDGSFDVR